MNIKNPFKKTFNLINQLETPLDGMSVILVLIFVLSYFILKSILNWFFKFKITFFI